METVVSVSSWSPCRFKLCETMASVESTGVPQNSENYDYYIQSHLLQLSYMPALQRQQALLNDGLLRNLKLLPHYNDDEFFSVQDDRSGKIYNVHRGSTTAEDWLVTDPAIASGTFFGTERFARSLTKSYNIDRRYNKKYGGKYDVVEVGHSLGGTLADEIGYSLKNSSVAFNPGASPLQQSRPKDRNVNKIYRIQGDPVSFSGSYQNGVQTLPKKPGKSFWKTPFWWYNLVASGAESHGTDQFIRGKA